MGWGRYWGIMGGDWGICWAGTGAAGTQAQAHLFSIPQRNEWWKAAMVDLVIRYVMFIPSTKNVTLIMALKEAETDMSNITRFRVRYQEAGGIHLARLFSTDLGKGQPCGRLDDEKIPKCKQ